MMGKLFYWFVVIIIWPRPFTDRVRMIRLNVSIFLRLLLIRYNAYTELLGNLRSQLKLARYQSPISGKLTSEMEESLDSLITDLAKVIAKRKARAETIEWELNELWTTDNILERVKDITQFIVTGNKCFETTPDEYYKKITTSHYVIFKSRKFITRDLLFTMMSGCVISMVGCMLFYYVGEHVTTTNVAMKNSLALTLQIVLAAAFFNGIRNNLAFFSQNPSEYKEIYNLDGRFYDNFMDVENIDFLLDEHDITGAAERVTALRGLFGTQVIPYSRQRVYTVVIRPYTLRNINIQDKRVTRIMDLTKDIRIAHETNDKTLETAKDLIHSLG